MAKILKKKCSRCKRYKPLAEFRERKDRGTYESHCKECGKKYHREWYQKNKKTVRKRMNAQEAKRRQEVRRQLAVYLKKHPCVDCGEGRQATLDFDHVSGHTKASVANMIGKNTWKVIQKEIAKCEVRCANCHREKTAIERGWYRDLGM